MPDSVATGAVKTSLCENPDGDSKVIVTFAPETISWKMNAKPYVLADCDIPFLKGVLEPYARVQYLKGSEI